MARKKKQKKIRTQFKHKYDERARKKDLTRDYAADAGNELESEQSERVSGKGNLARKRTVIGETVESDSGTEVLLEIDDSRAILGRVLRVHGLISHVESEDGTVYQCVTRKLLKTISTDQRHVVVAGDLVYFLPAASGVPEGQIVRIEPRTGVISRSSKNKRHVIAANVDQVFIVGSAAMPDLKPNLIDRLLITTEQAGIQPIVCINKIDLVDRARFQPFVGVYSQLGYTVLQVSATESWNLEPLRSLLRDKRSVVVGQSGVGKSSLLNAIQPGLALKVAAVSQENQKGKHTTTTASLIKLDFGGYIVDTPGVRQFELWDVVADEVAGFFRELRPFSDLCRFPNCTHTHEQDCQVKNRVADGDLDLRRYESYCRIRQDCLENQKN